MKYEYKTLIISYFGKSTGKTLEDELNKLGKEGWELVNSFPGNIIGGMTDDIVSVLKRAIQ